MWHLSRNLPGALWCCQENFQRTSSSTKFLNRLGQYNARAKVKRITLNIDDKEVTGEESMTILEVARGAGIDIPPLCYHGNLEPYGACRLCLVEIGTPPRTRLVTSCVYPAADGLVVKTRSERVIQTRKMLLELLLARAPGAKIIKDLAEEYGVVKARLRRTATFCILCGLCVRGWAEIKKDDAIRFIWGGVERGA